MDLTAEIVPYQSIGGIKIKSILSENKELIEGNHFKYEMYNYFFIKYYLDHLLEIHVNVLSGEVFKISAFEGYKGSLQGVQIGTILSEDRKAEMEFDDFEEIFIYNGATIETELVLNPDNNKWEDKVTCISVYTKELE
ncbi:hypothetical protein [Shouchella patagoniensis]|uniref:hypothetical protein n=1 Tax=Shouchella patagoniensis TaxID=228576 RepID=UPI0009957CFA|nr:hypothetical protein [Shouchella patagoniensis]